LGVLPYLNPKLKKLKPFITPKKTFLFGKATNLRTKVSLEAGKSYYYIHTAKATGLLSMDFLYQPISTEEGLSLSHNYKLISINDLGKEAHPSEIFKHFYRKIVTDQKDFIKLTYNETMEDMMFSEEERMRPKIIKSVCSELYNLSKIKK